MAEKVDLTRLYRGGYNPEPYEAQDTGVYGGLFASGTPEPASSHGPYLHYTDIPTNKILTHYALNYEVPHEKVKQALIKFAPHVKEDKELFDKLHDVVVGDKGQDLRNLDDDEILDLLRKQPGADADNEAQRLRGQLAKHLGYHAVELEDEHGQSYLTTHGVKFKPHVTKSKGGEVMPHHQREANKAKFLEPSKVKERLYHGTTDDINEFDLSHAGKKTGNLTTELGMFLSDNPKEASRYAEQWGTKGGNVMPVHVQVKNPYHMPYKEFDNLAMGAWNRLREQPNYDPNKVTPNFDREAHRKAAENLLKHEEAARQDVIKRRNELIEQGHDSVIVNIGGNREVIAFHPHQIKSAIGNRGTYDINESDINKAKGGVVSLLRKHGRPVDSDVDAMKKMSNGHRVFIAHEQDEKPREITSVSEMHGYTPDQIYTIAPEHFIQHKDLGGAIKSLATANNVSRLTDAPYIFDAVNSAKTGNYGDLIGSVVNAALPIGPALATYSADLNKTENNDLDKTRYVQGHFGRQERTWANGLAKGGIVKYPSIEEMLQKLQEAGRTPIMPAPDRWFKNPEKHPYQQKAIEKLLEYTGHNREAFPHGAHINPITGEPLDFEIMHDLGVAIDPVTGTPRMSGIKSGLTEIDPRFGTETKSNLIRKSLFKHEGGDPLLDRIKFLATIEKSGKGHHYGLSTQYASPAELVQEMRGNPTLRPHSRGDIYSVGDEVGRISIKGKHHPVYEKLLVAPSGMDVQGKKLHKAKGGVTHAHHLEIEERPL
jgi:hypothetical protein